MRGMYTMLPWVTAWARDNRLEEAVSDDALHQQACAVAEALDRREVAEEHDGHVLLEGELVLREALHVVEAVEQLRRRGVRIVALLDLVGAVAVPCLPREARTKRRVDLVDRLPIARALGRPIVGQRFESAQPMGQRRVRLSSVQH